MLNRCIGVAHKIFEIKYVVIVAVIMVILTVVMFLFKHSNSRKNKEKGGNLGGYLVRKTSR